MDDQDKRSTHVPTPPQHDGERRRLSSNFIASFLGRSLSLSEEPTTNYQYSERSNDMEDEQDDAIQPKPRSKSFSSDDGNTDKEMNNLTRTRRSLTLSSVLFGPQRQLGPDGTGEVLLSSESDSTDGIEFSKKNDLDKGISDGNSSNKEREISQTDHLNRKLLGSFLDRINNIATSFIDPAGTGQTAGQVYTDDVMMDRILRRVESQSKEK